MASLSERLAYLITANGDDAIHTFQKVGSAAEKDLGKAEGHAQKLGATFTKVGAGMLAFAGVAAVGLDHFAKQAESAEHSQLLLNNTLANSPRLAGATAAQFNDLATAIQNKTAADNKDIVAGIAVLGNFGLTAKQLQTMTPLLVDYARRTGKEIPDAAADLGKALLGNSRALKAIGVDFHNTGDVTGNYVELVGALREKVGGFADEEGKTFSASLQRLHNQLNDLEEGVGVGVIDAFTRAVHPVGQFSAWLAKTSPEGQKLTGQLLAVGAASIGAVGGLSFIAGQLAKLRSRFVETNAAGLSTLTTFGKFATGVGIAAGIAAITVSLIELNKQSNATRVNIDKVAKTSTADLVEAFLVLQKGPGPIGDRSLEAFRKTAEASIGTAQRLRDALAAQGVNVSALDKILASETTRQRQANADAKAGAAALTDEGDAASSAATQLTDYKNSLDALVESTLGVADAQDQATSSLLDLQKEADDAAKSRQDALQRQADAVQNVADAEEQAAQRIADAQQNVADAREEAGKISQPGQQRDEANKRVAEAEKTLGRTRQAAEREVATARKEAKKAAEEVTKATDAWKPSLDRATAAGLEHRKRIEEVVAKSIAAAEEMKKEGVPASEITAYLESQRDRVRETGTALGFNLGLLQQYLTLLNTAADGPGLAVDATNAIAALGAGTSTQTGKGGGTVNNITINATTNANENDIARAVDRALRRRG